MGLLAGSIVGSGGVLELRRLRQERNALSEKLFEQLRRNDELRRRIMTLRGSDQALERLARRKLGLVREDEVVYRFRSRNGEPPDSANAGL